MKKTFFLLFIIFLLNGCAESFALLGSTAGGVSSVKIAQSSLHSVTSFLIKKQTGKTPLGHAMAYAEKNSLKKKKEPCSSFIEKTNSKVCIIVEKKIRLTKAKIINNKQNDKSSKNFSSSLKSKIDKEYKIKYLD
jgi:hypothetical protein